MQPIELWGGRLGRGLAPALAVVLVLVGLAQVRGPAARGQAGGSVTELALEPIAELTLHGVTPSLAWSPDGRRLLINSAFGAYADEPRVNRWADELGVHVLDAATGARLQLKVHSALHPFWLDTETIGWGNDLYSGGQPGVFLAPARQSAQPRRVGRFESVHRTHLGRDGSVLAYLASESSWGWYSVDPRTGQARPAFDPDRGESPGSWDTPAALIVDQCPTRMGQVAAVADPAGFVELSLGAERFRLAGVRPWVFRHDYGPGSGRGPVQPCLSPDGRQLAYLAAGASAEEYSLRVVRVPSIHEARAQARSIAAAAPSGGLKPVAELALHGSTPCLAWSPDGRRVVANAAYEYYGHEQEIAAHGSELGIWVLDAASGGATHVFSGQGYHPFWFSPDLVGWGHSEYEQGAPGIYSAPVRPGSRPRRIGQLKGVHRTLLSTDGRVLVYVGFPEYKRWGLVDPRSGAFEPIAELAEVSSWDDPAGHYRDQCLQATPGARLQSDAEHGFVLEVGTRRVLLSGRPLVQVSGEQGAGVVRACLSPDGSRVAFLTQAPAGPGKRLQIAQVPY